MHRAIMHPWESANPCGWGGGDQCEDETCDEADDEACPPKAEAPVCDFFPGHRGLPRSSQRFLRFPKMRRCHQGWRRCRGVCFMVVSFLVTCPPLFFCCWGWVFLLVGCRWCLAQGRGGHGHPLRTPGVSRISGVLTPWCPVWELNPHTQRPLCVGRKGSSLVVATRPGLYLALIAGF